MARTRRGAVGLLVLLAVGRRARLGTDQRTRARLIPDTGSGPGFTGPSATPSPAPSPTPSPSAVAPDQECGFIDVACEARQAINEWFAHLVESASKPVFTMLGSTVLATPELNSPGMARARQLWEVSRTIANTCFVLLVTAAGVMLMAGQALPGESSARELLPRLVWAFLAANLSLVAIRYAIALANGLSQAFLADGASRIDPESVFKVINGTILAGIATHGVFFAIVALVAVVLAVGVVFTYVVRLALTMVLIAAAPLALIFHALPMTEGLARLWWRSFTGLLAIQICQSARARHRTATPVLRQPGRGRRRVLDSDHGRSDRPAHGRVPAVRAAQDSRMGRADDLAGEQASDALTPGEVADRLSRAGHVARQARRRGTHGTTFQTADPA